jgi:translation initiation factor IF-3
MSKAEALAKAKEAELDLVEVAPNAKPPVAKIISWSKFKYDQSKKRRESKNKAIEQKEMWFNVHIDKGDMEHKLKRVREFLEKKHPVKLTVRAKGRTNRDNMKTLMDSIISAFGEEVLVDAPPKFEGRNYAVYVKPAKH